MVDGWEKRAAQGISGPSYYRVSALYYQNQQSPDTQKNPVISNEYQERKNKKARKKARKKDNCDNGNEIDWENLCMQAAPFGKKKKNGTHVHVYIRYVIYTTPWTRDHIFKKSTAYSMEKKIILQ